MIAIVDYGMGNLGSIRNMLSRVGAESVITNDPEVINGADKLILPGVGAFDNAVINLQRLGLVPVLNHLVLQRKVPLLGICLGMQLLMNRSEEGRLLGLGWIEGHVIRFRFDDADPLRVPHMGWNTVSIRQAHPLLDDMSTDSRFYFVHSYHVVCAKQENVLAETVYGHPFHSAVVNANIVGTQFHPEKSHRFGMELLRNFAEWRA